MNTKLIKPILVLSMLVLLGSLWMQRGHIEHQSDIMEKLQVLEKQVILSKDLDLQIALAVNSITINYDDLNHVSERYISFLGGVQECLIEKDGLCKSLALAQQKVEHVDYIKRSNSIIRNSLNYLKAEAIEKVYAQHFEEKDLAIKAEVIEIINALELFSREDGAIHGNIKSTAQNFWSHNFRNPHLQSFQASLLRHVPVLLDEGERLYHSLQSIEALNQKTLAHHDHMRMILGQKLTEAQEGFNLREKLFTFIIIVLFIALYMLTGKLEKHETKIKAYAKELQLKILQATKELREQKEVYETLFHKSADGILLFDGQVFSACNEAATTMLGYPRYGLKGVRPEEISPKYQPDGTLSTDKADSIKQDIAERGTQRFEWQFVKKDGTTLWSEVILTPIVLNERQVVYTVWRDISVRKAMELELEALNQNLQKRIDEEIRKNELQHQKMLQQSRLAQMGEMLSMIAHQWRQPLASISAISGTLTIDTMMEQYDKVFFQERLEAINDMAQHLSSTIDDFRGFFKEDKEKEQITLETMARQSIQIIEPTLEARGIALFSSFDGDETVETYPNEVKQVLLNVLKNAEDALLEKKSIEPKIWINAYLEADTACLSIEDNAGGIPDDVVEKIFEPYFTTKKQRDGTGLGLYMSKTIIEEHCGGSLEITNTEHGARFTIKLPRSRQGADQ